MATPEPPKKWGIGNPHPDFVQNVIKAWKQKGETYRKRSGFSLETCLTVLKPSLRKCEKVGIKKEVLIEAFTNGFKGVK